MASNAPAEQGRRRRWPTVTECAARGSETPCTQGLPTRRCGLCGAVAYCSTNHQISHWSEHRKECARLEEQMKRMDVLSDFPFTFFMQDGNEPRSQLSSCLSCWDDYYQWRHLPLHSPVALLLHWNAIALLPLTVYHCFQVLSAHSSISKVKAELNIHYLGPEKELLQLGVFRELLALFPGVQIYLNLVGPAVPQFRDGETVSLCKYLPCAEESCICKSLYPDSVAEGSNHRNATIRIRLHKGFYHDRYRTIIKDSYPHLIIAPNAGVAAYSSWLPTVELIKGMGIPAIFTDFCEEAANLAANCISSVTGQPLRLPIQINPFRQPMVVEDSVLYLPCYSNCFLFGM
ncbi:hypothetical protein ZIOFF_002845 [Zingiber officinale]|uniref:MYND-type domain-containing protein n=1 Tax=Zingiber officinale TaxID=94328 RepID=A0A8J5LT08_ZINOF|nr:hypothetical protein ZIOFF_002845 [Zingiber officinale]